MHKKNQIEFKLKISNIKIRGNKSYEQLNTVKNTLNFYESRQEVINFFKDYYKIMNNAIYDAKYGKGLKIMIPKQMCQRLKIALAQVKADNTSENVLNEIRQIIYYLC